MNPNEDGFRSGSKIDCHTHAGGENPYGKFMGQYPFVQSVCDLRFKQHALGIENTIVFPMPGTYYYRIDRVTHRNFEPSGLMAFPFEVENEALLQEIEIARQLFPDGRIFPFLNIHPSEEIDHQIDHLDKLMKQYGFAGLKFHASGTNTDAEAIISTPFIQFMRYYNIPLIVHSGVFKANADPKHALKLAVAHPDVRISVAHLAAWDKEALGKITQLPNAFVDCSPYLANFASVVQPGHEAFVSKNRFPSSFTDPVTTLIELQNYLKGKLLWGTDEPWTTYNFDTGMLIIKATYKDEVKILEDVEKEGHTSVLGEIVNINPQRFLFGK